MGNSACRLGGTRCQNALAGTNGPVQPEHPLACLGRRQDRVKVSLSLYEAASGGNQKDDLRVCWSLDRRGRLVAPSRREAQHSPAPAKRLMSRPRPWLQDRHRLIHAPCPPGAEAGRMACLSAPRKVWTGTQRVHPRYYRWHGRMGHRPVRRVETGSSTTVAHLRYVTGGGMKLQRLGAALDGAAEAAQYPRFPALVGQRWRHAEVLHEPTLLSVLGQVQPPVDALPGSCPRDGCRDTAAPAGDGQRARTSAMPAARGEHRPGHVSASQSRGRTTGPS